MARDWQAVAFISLLSSRENNTVDVSAAKMHCHKYCPPYKPYYSLITLEVQLLARTSDVTRFLSYTSIPFFLVPLELNNFELLRAHHQSCLITLNKHVRYKFIIPQYLFIDLPILLFNHLFLKCYP